jgi:hypothetical protein
MTITLYITTLERDLIVDALVISSESVHAYLEDASKDPDQHRAEYVARMKHEETVIEELIKRLRKA